jgi:hypothetical protein
MSNQINPVFGDMEMIDFSDENDKITENTIILDERSEKCEKKNNKVLKYGLKLILHALIHISMLSLLETLFFFYYAAPTEKDFLLDQLDSAIVSFDMHEDELRGEFLYKYLTENNDGSYIDNYYTGLKTDAMDSKRMNDNINNELYNSALFFVYICSGTTVVYYGMYQYIYRKKHFIFKIVFEHLFLIMFIGLYELWFFKNIVINYKFMSEDELVYYIFSCYWDSVRNNYPELVNFEKNVSIVCNSV